MDSTRHQQLQLGSEKRTIDLAKVKLTPDEALTCLTDCQVDVILPSPSVKACNNLEEYFYRSTLNLKKSQSQSHTKSSKPQRSAKKNHSFSSEVLAVPLTRNFDRILKRRDSGDEFGSTSMFITRPKKIQQDVFYKATHTEKSSALNFLKERLGKKVKIQIRRRRKCPFISRVLDYRGKLVLYDKHMNVFLEDVIESFAYKSSDSMVVKRARHRANLFLRGDNIIVIS